MELSKVCNRSKQIIVKMCMVRAIHLAICVTLQSRTEIFHRKLQRDNLPGPYQSRRCRTTVLADVMLTLTTSRVLDHITGRSWYLYDGLHADTAAHPLADQLDGSRVWTNKSSATFHRLNHFPIHPTNQPTNQPINQRPQKQSAIIDDNRRQQQSSTACMKRMDNYPSRR